MISVDVDSDLTWIKFNMTKWLKQLSRLQDFDRFLQLLEQKKAITNECKKAVEESSKGEQMHSLVLNMLQETKTKEDIFNFCYCLRQVDDKLADLLENNNSDGKDIGKIMKNYTP